MNPVEQDHDKKHEDGIEEVEVCLMSQKISVKPLEVLDGTEHRADHDQETSKVQRPHMFPPGDTAVGTAGGCCIDGPMKSNSKNDKEPEADKLDEETNDDDLGAIFKGFQASRGLIATTWVINVSTSRRTPTRRCLPPP